MKKLLSRFGVWMLMLSFQAMPFCLLGLSTWVLIPEVTVYVHRFTHPSDPVIGFVYTYMPALWLTCVAAMISHVWVAQQNGRYSFVALTANYVALVYVAYRMHSQLALPLYFCAAALLLMLTLYVEGRSTTKSAIGATRRRLINLPEVRQRILPKFLFRALKLNAPVRPDRLRPISF
jgi:hypothetical protein